MKASDDTKKSCYQYLCLPLSYEQVIGDVGGLTLTLCPCNLVPGEDGASFVERFADEVSAGGWNVVILCME